MTVVRFERGLFAEVRFGASAMIDVSCAARLTLDPEAQPGALEPWWRRARAAVARVDLPLTAALHAPGRYVPDFLVSKPGHRPSLLADLRALVALDPVVVRRGLAFAYPDALPADLRVLRSRPAVGLGRLARELALFARLTLGGTRWLPLRGLSAAEAWRRGQLLASAGARVALVEPIPGITIRDDALVVHDGRELEVRPSLEGFWLVPSPFAPQPPPVTLDPDSHGGIAYVPPGVAQATYPSADDALAALLGRTRARLLRALVTPACTSELAALLGLAPSTVSEHLGALRSAGLVTGERAGRVVSYALAARGRRLLAVFAD
ncbi:MAG: winged helix-turn-helix domain-containing protein [Gaiellales bacterium]